MSTSDEAFYFLDRLDYVLDRDHLRQRTQRPECAMGPRIRTPMIGETASLQRVAECHPTGLPVAMRWALGSYKMAPETASFITENFESVQLPGIRTGGIPLA